MSPRPPKARCLSCPRPVRVFKPAGRGGCRREWLHLAPDEFEAFILADWHGLSQEEAGERMGVSRGTVQRLLGSARSKVAQALLQGRALVLDSVEEEHHEDRHSGA